ncbi:MAG: YlxR family protein [Symploca sp. SIO3C6]|uniref:YlxR family protein n=1 Tax=Symploca sp. SIO1C4 TaxID=2607765 RepID=A0A6B3NEB7_9CYAN|nr:YlxR family protein [Symploca sp. SIO3C6]NER29953.1 YlxR family protein [Symploca sp. SIO1C4]
MKPNYRRCLSCRTILPKEAFWRVVRVHPSRNVQLDEGMGRSAYLCPKASCLATAQKKNRLGRVLRAPVPSSLYQTLWERLVEASAVGASRLAGEPEHLRVKSLKAQPKQVNPSNS